MAMPVPALALTCNGSDALHGGDLRGRLLRHAADAEDPAALALAGTVAAAFEVHGLRRLPLPGLSAADTATMLHAVFPGAAQALGFDPTVAVVRVEPRFDEIEDLVALLLDEATPGCPGAHTRWVAHAVAAASLCSDHLWQDLRLPSRRVLGALLEQWFAPLARRNVHDMKWKKFLYKQLCERSGLSLCRAPSCQQCDDRPLCFGSEDD